jgi:hypothetical protein
MKLKYEGDNDKENYFNIIDEQGHAFFIQSIDSFGGKDSDTQSRFARYETVWVKTFEEALVMLNWHNKVLNKQKWYICKINRHTIEVLE